MPNTGELKQRQFTNLLVQIEKSGYGYVYISYICVSSCLVLCLVLFVLKCVALGEPTYSKPPVCTAIVLSYPILDGPQHYRS